MKRSEKIITAVLTMVFGILLMVLQNKFISILMTIVGVCFIVLGVVDFFRRTTPPAIVKIVSGLLLIICGWAVVEAVLYVLAAMSLIAGILFLYDKVKNGSGCKKGGYLLLEYALPALCIVIGIVLLFHALVSKKFIFITTGFLVILLGGVILFNAFTEEEN
ncbi:MAG: DUF308 domain-containing protein [Clostridia bacterium]|nr:DUF308 domain-containing protein [Clostridia bacterium]